MIENDEQALAVCETCGESLFSPDDECDLCIAEGLDTYRREHDAGAER